LRRSGQFFDANDMQKRPMFDAVYYDRNRIGFDPDINAAEHHDDVIGVVQIEGAAIGEMETKRHERAPS
jgi:hypothetical protein